MATGTVPCQYLWGVMPDVRLDFRSYRPRIGSYVKKLVILLTSDSIYVILTLDFWNSHCDVSVCIQSGLTHCG
jgi:hypothetical protein